MSVDSLPTVRLKAGRERTLKRRPPWVFSGAIAGVAGNPASGDTVRVQSESGEPLALGAWSSQSQIRVRVWSFDAGVAIDAGFVARRIAQAIAARRRLGLLDLPGACRLVFAEADGLPGLVVDRYAEFLACQFLAAGVERWREAVLDALETELRPRVIFERSEASARRKEGLPSARGLLRGPLGGGRVHLGARPGLPRRRGAPLRGHARPLLHLRRRRRVGVWRDPGVGGARPGAQTITRRNWPTSE